MNHTVKNIFIIFLSTVYIITISTFIQDSFFNITIVKDMFSITSSFSVVIITIFLYDRFNYRKIIFEKKLELVLKLLENIKTLQIQVTYQRLEPSKMYAGFLRIDREEIRRYCDGLNPHANILFGREEMNTYFKEINAYRINPFLPKEISKNLHFLSITYLEAVTSNKDYKNESVKISINRNPKNLIDLENWYKPAKNISFYDFTNNYLICLLSIEKWIDKHSNIKSDLNI